MQLIKLLRIKGEVLTYNTKYSFVKLKNIDDIKKLPLDPMFNLMKEHHKKLNSLIDLKPRSRENKHKRLEVIIHAGDIYNELYNIYRSKYNKKIDSLSVKNKKKLDYKQLKISGDGQYLSDEEQEEEQERQEEEQEKQEEKQNKKTIDADKYIERMIDREDAHVNQEIFQKYFKIQKPSLMCKVLRTANDKERDSNLVDMFSSALKNLKEETKNMTEEEKEIEKPDEIVRVVKMILDFSEIDQQKGQGLKILTPNQMLSRLPISLAQLQAGNNSDKLKNEIRQLLYSLYRSKNMTKQVYNNLMNTYELKKIIKKNKKRKIKQLSMKMTM